MIKEWNSLAWNSNILSNNVIVVKETQTVQQVLDSITDASETNKYLVLVPSGHELEYFDWKPNVEVKFLDNLDERWQLDELEGWDDLSNWIIGSAFTPSIEDIQGRNWLKLAVSDVEGAKNSYFKMCPSLLTYQGLLITIKLTNKKISQNLKIECYIHDIADSYIKPAYLDSYGLGEHELTLFIPFNFDNFSLSNVNEQFNWESIKYIQLHIEGFDDGDEILFSNFKLVRTFPYPCLFLRTDDSSLGSNYNRVRVLKEIENRRLPIIWAIIAENINWQFGLDNNLPTPEMLQEFQDKSYISIVNHSLSHPNFHDDLQDNEKDTLFEVESSMYIFERLGLKDALQWWVNPYQSTNYYLQKYLKEFGYKSVYSTRDSVPLCIPSFSTFLEQTYNLKKGGIATFLFHSYDLGSEGAIEDLLNQIDNILQTHRPVSIRDIERLMDNSHEKFSPRQTKPTLFQVLDSDFDMYFYHKQLFLDPNGTDRNINVQPYELRPGDPALIVNTGSTGNLIFDPSGLNLTIQSGQSANVIYDGDQWRQI